MQLHYSSTEHIQYPLWHKTIFALSINPIGQYSELDIMELELCDETMSALIKCSLAWVSLLLKLNSKGGWYSCVVYTILMYTFLEPAWKVEWFNSNMQRWSEIWSCTGSTRVLWNVWFHCIQSCYWILFEWEFCYKCIFITCMHIS